MSQGVRTRKDTEILERVVGGRLPAKAERRADLVTGIVDRYRGLPKLTIERDVIAALNLSYLPGIFTRPALRLVRLPSILTLDGGTVGQDDDEHRHSVSKQGDRNRHPNLIHPRRLARAGGHHCSILEKVGMLCRTEIAAHVVVAKSQVSAP